MSKFAQLATAAQALTSLHSEDRAEPHSVVISHDHKGPTWDIFLPAVETQELIDNVLAYSAVLADVRHEVYRIDQYVYLKAEGTFAGLRGKISGATYKHELLPLLVAGNRAEVTVEQLKHLNNLCHGCGQQLHATPVVSDATLAEVREVSEANNAEVTA